MTQPVKSKTSTNTPLIASPEFVTELRLIFERTPLISNAEGLKEQLKPLLSLDGVSYTRIKKELTKYNILEYSRSKPAG